MKYKVSLSETSRLGIYLKKKKGAFETLKKQGSTLYTPVTQHKHPLSSWRKEKRVPLNPKGVPKRCGSRSIIVDLNIYSSHQQRDPRIRLLQEAREKREEKFLDAIKVLVNCTRCDATQSNRAPQTGRLIVDNISIPGLSFLSWS